MRKKRRAHVNHDRWLVSYADFITLLFAFFVVLFATGQSDKRKTAELAVSIQAAFSQMGIFVPRSGVPRATRTVADAGFAATSKLAPPMSSSAESMAMMKRHIELAAGPEIATGVVSVRESAATLVISLREVGFFDSCAADIRSSALPVLNRIAAVLPETALRVEGHTDNVPIHTPQFASNWELSSARASSIARLLLLHPNVHAEQMSVAGYAEYHPVGSNATAAGRARNRRVDVVALARAPE